MGGNSEWIEAIPKAIPGKYKVVDNSNHLEAPPIPDTSRKTAIAIDAAGLLYGQGETIHATALANIYKTNRLSRVPNVEIIFYIQDDKTPGAKYALKTEDGVMPTPPEGFEKFFASYSQLQGSATNDLSEIGKEAVGKRRIQWDYPIDKDFGRRVLGNRTGKQAVAKYMCQQVFETTPIAPTQTLYVMGPGFCRARTGKMDIIPNPRYCTPYNEGEYKCVELANVVAEQYHMQIYSKDTDTVMASLLAWPRILTIVAEDEATPVESIRFKNIVLTIQHWHEKNKPLSYIRMNEMWYAFVLRMAVLARFVNVPAPRAATATLVALMAFRGNDYVVQIPQLTPDRLLATFQQNFHRLSLPLVIEGPTARDFKMNCRGFLEFFLYAYKDKYPTIVVDFDNLEASYASVQAAVPALQRAKVSYNAMRGRCANVCWYMRYLIASQMGQDPDLYYETNERGISLWGYRRNSPELTAVGWEDVDITDNVDIAHFDFGN
jgi:hypothetical protein